MPRPSHQIHHALRPSSSWTSPQDSRIGNATLYRGSRISTCTSRPLSTSVPHRASSPDNILRILRCSDPDDVRSRLQDFWNRLISRGCQLHRSSPSSLRGLHNQRYIACPPTKTTDTSCVFFHLRYHPQDPPIPRSDRMAERSLNPAFRTPLENDPRQNQKLQHRLIIFATADAI
jgi:hypothetical protein